MGLNFSSGLDPMGAASVLPATCGCVDPVDSPPGTPAVPTGGAPEHLLRQFRIGHVLGEGACGVVYSCLDSCTGEEVAVKVVETAGLESKAVEQEASLLRGMLHDNIVRLRKVVLDEDVVSLVMDIWSGGDLISGVDRHMKSWGIVRAVDVAHISSQTSASLQYLHWKGIVHRDIKGENFVMDMADIADPKCRIALCDFGTACSLEPAQRLSQQTGTRNFWAPEIFAKDYGLKVDVWALGIMMFGVLTGGYPFSDEHGVKNAPLEVPACIDATCADYLRLLLHKGEALRAGASEAVSHAWHA